jgi:hypothetical protein
MQEKVGNIMASILILIIFLSIGISLFTLIFRDGRGLGMYGNRGNSYFYSE